MDPDKEVLTTSRNILDNEVPKFYRQAITRTNADLWHSTIEAEMAAFRRNHTWDVVDRPPDRRIVDSKWIIKIKHLSDGSVETFKARLVAKEFPKFRARIIMRGLPQWYVSIPCASLKVIGIAIQLHT
jgi:hypothetical protein